MFSYAINFQIISLLVILTDPITKGFLSKYGNISMVAYYQMSKRLVQMCRSFLVSANQVLVPVFANLKQLEPHKILNTYLTSYRFIFYLAFPGFCLLVVSAPLISKIWIGHFEVVFIWSTVLLSAGWLINTLSVPAYYADMGTGNMRFNVITHVVTTCTNLILILIIGQLYEGLGVIIAWSMAVALGGFVLNILYYKRNGISFSNIAPHESRLLTLACLIGLFIAWQVWRQSTAIKTLIVPVMVSPFYIPYITSIMTIVCFIMITAVPIWKHDIRKQLIKMLRDLRS